MPDLPEHPTCTIKSGERVELKPDRVILPDGSTLVDLTGCTLEPGSIMVIQYDEPPRPHRKHVQLPADPSPTDAPPDASSTAVSSALPPSPPKVPPGAAVNPVTVALAVGMAGTAGSLGLRRLRVHKANVQTQQQKKEERQRQQCATRSDTVLVDFKARTADFRMRQLVEVVEPVELWRRADSLDDAMADLQRILRAKAKTRRA